MHPLLDCPYQFCGGIISAIIFLGVNNFGGRFPFFWGAQLIHTLKTYSALSVSNGLGITVPLPQRSFKKERYTKAFPSVPM